MAYDYFRCPSCHGADRVAVGDVRLASAARAPTCVRYCRVGDAGGRAKTIGTRPESPGLLSRCLARSGE